MKNFFSVKVLIAICSISLISGIVGHSNNWSTSIIATSLILAGLSGSLSFFSYYFVDAKEKHKFQISNNHTQVLVDPGKEIDALKSIVTASFLMAYNSCGTQNKSSLVNPHCGEMINRLNDGQSFQFCLESAGLMVNEKGTISGHADEYLDGRVVKTKLTVTQPGLIDVDTHLFDKDRGLFCLGDVLDLGKAIFFGQFELPKRPVPMHPLAHDILEKRDIFRIPIADLIDLLKGSGDIPEQVTFARKNKVKAVFVPHKKAWRIQGQMGLVFPD